jgi:parallel beta-helix repeat protein
MSCSPAAFFSYVRFVDQHEEGRITELRSRLEGEVRVYLGDEFSIFQDREIGWGDEWKLRIEDVLDAATFFIPVLTPAFFKSRYCREEMETFLEREKKLGRRDLVLPIYYVDIPLFNDITQQATDPLAVALAARQYADWRNLRYELWTDPQVGRRLSQMAVRIRDALGPSRKSLGTPAASRSAGHRASNGEVGAEFTEKTVAGSGVVKEPPTRIVDQMHRGDYTTISDAIKAAFPGDRILVRPGFYPEGLVIEKPLEILGDGPKDEVIVQASGKSALLFRTTMGRVKNLTLRQVGGGDHYGISIAQGRLELEDCDISSQSHACVAIYKGADPRLRHNRIHHGRYAGIFVYDNGQGTLEENEIFENGLSGIEIVEKSKPAIRRNRIHGNMACGVAIAESGQGVLENNEIFGNEASGIEVSRESRPVFLGNRIYRNRQSGIYIHTRGGGTFEKNEIFDNLEAGLVVEGGGSPILLKNTITGHYYAAVWIKAGGGGIFEDNDLGGNMGGTWKIAPGTEERVRRKGNIE